MTQQDLALMEAKLQVTLPATYKRIVASFPWPEFAGGAEFSFWDDAVLNVERTLEYRAGYGGAPAWPADYVHIGDDDDACPYALCCSDATIVKTDHGNLTTQPLARFASVELFVRRLQEEFDNEGRPRLQI